LIEEKSTVPRRLSAIVAGALIIGCCIFVGVIGAAYAVSQRLSTPAEPLAPGELPVDVLEQMMEIETQVIALRGLEANGQFERLIFSQAELEDRVTNDFFADYAPEDAADDVIILAAFGLIDPEFDLLTFYQALFSEQIAGFYDPETHEMVVVQSAAFRGPERLTYAHEYNHALQDQTYDLQDGLGYNDDACEADSERCAAIQALIEGDASKLELEWFLEYGTRRDSSEIQQFYDNLESPVYDSAPAYLREDFIFPYTTGFDFVDYLFKQGGWPAVDAAYVNLPVSTEQILHPERYPADTPLNVELPDLLPDLGQGWELLDENVMGEWYTFLILAHGADPLGRLPEADAQIAAEGWGGDRYAVYYQRALEQTVAVLSHTWDSRQDALEFSLHFASSADARFRALNESGSAALWEANGWIYLLAVDGEHTHWVIAPDRETAETVLSRLSTP
jgi:hypothetical protein